MDFEKMINDYEPMIRLVVNKYSVKGMDKDDLKQECLLKLWEVHKQYNDKYEVSTFIYTVLTNHLRELVRNSMAQKRVNHVTNDGGIDTIMADITNYDFTNYCEMTDDGLIEFRLELYDLVKRFSKSNIIYGILNGKTYREIGDELGFSRQYVGAVFKEFIKFAKGEL